MMTFLCTVCRQEKVLAILERSIPWEDLAALPEVYSTAWTALFTVLALRRGERLLLLRGNVNASGLQVDLRVALPEAHTDELPEQAGSSH